MTLQRGVRLRVNLQRAEPRAYLTLVREGGGEEGWERMAWPRAADTPSLAWDSLPPGRYGIVAADFDPRTFAPRTPLITVDLDSDAAIDLTIPPRPKPMADAVALFVDARELRDVKAIVSRAGTSAVVPHAIERTSGGMLLHLATTAPARELFVTTADSIITARDSYEAIVTPRADAIVRLTAGTLPRWMTAELHGCSTNGQRPSVAVMVTSDGVAEVPLPGGCRSLLLRAEGYAPLILAATLAPRTTQRFGPYGLRPAGAARVRVAREPSRSSVPGATVRASAGDAVVAEGTTDEGGQVTLRGLPAGDVTFTASTSDDGELTGVAVMPIESGAVAVIDPLLIPAPAALAMRLRLSLPDAKIVSVVIEQERARRSATPDDGQLLFRDLRPGAWRPHALIEYAGSVQPVPLAPIELRGGETRRVDLDVEPFVVEGEVLSGGKPFPSQVGFGSRSERRFARTDAAGRFTIVLPERGTYNVSATPLNDPGGSIDAGEIECSGAPVTVLIPSGGLRVRVLDGGKPAGDARVRAVLRRGSALEALATTVRGSIAGPRGETQLDHLLEGRWLVQASAASGNAEAAAEVRGGEAGLVELELRPPSALRGIVRHADRSIETQARVDCLLAGPSGIPQSVRSETDGEGRFAFDLPTPPPTRLHCGVTTTGGRIAAYTLSPTPAADLVLPASTATLRLADWNAGVNRDLYWLVSGDRLFNLSWSNGIATGLPSGSWKIVQLRDPADWMRLGTAGGNALTPIREFRLEEGQATTVRLQSDGGERASAAGGEMGSARPLP